MKKRGMTHRILFWFGMITIVFFASCCTEKGITESFTESDGMKKNRLLSDEIEVGSPVNCVQLLERKMKTTDEHFKYIVTIYGIVTEIDLPEIHITVEKVTALNLKNENGTWTKDRSVVKRPPYTIGNTYAFKPKHDIIDNAVSEGVYQIYFERP